MTDRAHEGGLEIRDEILGPEHGTAKLEQADGCTREIGVA